MPDPLKVALSVDALGPRLTGIGRYCLELAERMPGAIGAGNISYFRGDHWIDDPHELLEEDWRPARRNRWLRRYETWARARRLSEIVIHAPNYFLPAWAERGVATIHDLSVFLYPEAHPAERVKAFEQQFERTLQQARMLLTDTETVRQELIAMFGVAPERIQAVTLGVSQGLRDPDWRLLHELGLAKHSYLLCVSTFEPRKRIDRLVEAYTALPLALRQRYPLVLAGASGWHNEALNELIEDAARDGTVRRLGFVSEASLAALYAGAALFIYPSRYEGFGLPVLEAMAHGVPCMIADAACLIEVAGGAAAIIDPDDRVGFTAAIADKLEDHAWRESASRAGTAVAESYSWEACAARTVEVYRRVAA